MKKFFNKHHPEVFFTGAFMMLIGAAAVQVSPCAGLFTAIPGLIGMGLGIYGVATS